MAVSNWISVPGLVIPEGSNASFQEYLAYVEESESRVDFMLNDVFILGGTKEYSVVMINRLKPESIFVAMSNTKFREEFFKE